MTAGHDAAGHDAAGHDAAGHDAAGHDAAGHDAAGHDAAGHDAAGHDAQVERLEHEVSLLLRRSRSVLRALAGRIHPEVDAGAYAVLLTVGRAGPLRLVELADEFGLDKSTMSRQVTSLLQLGLLVRRPDPDDGRAFLLELSGEGRDRLDAVSRARHEVWRERLAAWSTAEIAALADGLTRLATTLPAPERPDPL